MFNWLISSKKSESVNKDKISSIQKNVTENFVIPAPPSPDLQVAMQIRNTRYNPLYQYHPEELNEDIEIAYHKINRRKNRRKARMIELAKEISQEYQRRRDKQADKTFLGDDPSQFRMSLKWKKDY